MKKIKLLSYTVLSILVFTIACKDESRVPALERGVNSRVLFSYPDNAYLNAKALATAVIAFDVYSENTDLDKIEFTATYKNSLGVVSAPKLALTLSGSAFKNGKAEKVIISATDLATAFGIAGGPTKFGSGESFTFTQKMYLLDGRTFDVTNSAPSIAQSATSSFTPNFTVFVACPFVIADAVGTYTITRDDLGVVVGAGNNVSIIAGPGPNQVTLKNLFGHPEKYDIIVDVDPVKGDITIAKQNAWNCANIGCTFGVATMEAAAGSGTFFSCTGFLYVDAVHKVATGTFGANRLELHKN